MGRWVTGPERITSRVTINPETGCWDWQSGSRTLDGYGTFVEGYAHRVSYETFVGPIPEGYQVDHLCNRTRCVNPTHLEPVTPAENMRRVAERRSSCKNGHPFTPENTYDRPGSGRQCRACNADAVRRYKARRAGADA